ncbi:uncharacterized protein LOC111064436 [Nilaparvata lugens]|uniref:uncharacterized protein LOC111064436 n=1 Tax=Nilaparvata lugens TaxID=108931 RepID=UPI00193E439E|nr:uncharacterized protein LOC111064436 [Nilaparvata lugens]XP_039289313.1 uncharacterized protein LOC111064436 [Nilaparvata lugens]
MISSAVLPLFALAFQLTSAQFFGHQLAQPQSLSFAIQPPPLQPAPGAAFFDAAPSAGGPLGAPLRRDYSHRAVVLNAEREAQLPANLLNPFYKNPRIAEALAKESWFTNEEMHVTDREAEKIPRQKIYSVLKNAGFVNRRRR